jgi:MFS transporter, OFA family, oxalate/formate antiporter
MSVAIAATTTRPSAYRWLQLVFGVICMVMIANLQYGWTLFVNPIDDKFHWGLPAIQWAFTIFVATETWPVPVEGWFVDRFGPKNVVLFGGILVGVAWTINSFAASLTVLYIAAAIGGVGAGAVYGTCVGNALKWFPDRRGLCAGLTAAGFGAGSAATVIPIQNLIAGSGYQTAFLYFGIGQGLVILALALFLRAPRAGETPAPRARLRQSAQDYSWNVMIWSPVFWVMYAMFVLVAAGGLMITANLRPIAKDFHLEAVPVTLFWLTMPALTFALTIDRILNGVTRPFFGWVSDNIGRENTMLIAFGLEAVGIYALSIFGHDPVMFVILSGVVFFAWGEIYSLFPSTCADIFGARYATANAGLLYTAKGTASLLVPFSNVLAQPAGSWNSVFVIAAVMNLAAALAAPFALRPFRARHEALVASGRFMSEGPMLTAALIFGILGGGASVVVGLYTRPLLAAIGLLAFAGCGALKANALAGGVLMLLSAVASLLGYGLDWWVLLPLLPSTAGGTIALISYIQGTGGKTARFGKGSGSELTTA